MDWTNIILSALGSIASMLGIVLTIKKEGRTRNYILYIALFILSATTSFFSYKYAKSTNEKLDLESRKKTLREDAARLYTSSPKYINFYEPGESEGVVYGLLLLLEANKDIYPDSYSSYKKTVVDRIEKSDAQDTDKKREIMKDAGNSALQLLKNLSGM